MLKKEGDSDKICKFKESFWLLWGGRADAEKPLGKMVPVVIAEVTVASTRVKNGYGEKYIHKIW